MDICYIARRNAISASVLECFRGCIERFHELREAFIACGVRKKLSLPHQHAFNHYYSLIQSFGSPNGLCSSITESKHVEAVKDTWRWSSRFKAITQIVTDLQGPPSESTPEDKIRDLKSLARQYARDRGSCDDTRISYLEFVESEAEADLTLARMIAG
jgi:hypothetical protein